MVVVVVGSGNGNGNRQWQLGRGQGDRQWQWLSQIGKHDQKWRLPIRRNFGLKLSWCAFGQALMAEPSSSPEQRQWPTGFSAKLGADDIMPSGNSSSTGMWRRRSSSFEARLAEDQAVGSQGRPFRGFMARLHSHADLGTLSSQETVAPEQASQESWMQPPVEGQGPA